MTYAISLYTLVETFPKLHALHAENNFFPLPYNQITKVHMRLVVLLLQQINEETEAALAWVSFMHTSILSSASC
jgi:hypothetical protein